MWANFQTKKTTLTLLAQICQKTNLNGLEIQKTNVGIRIRNLEIPCVPAFRQNGQFWIFRPKFGELAQLHAIFWSEYCWECCRELRGGWNELGGGGWNWVEVKMSRVEVDGAAWSWVEVDGTGWSWVHGLVKPLQKTAWPLLSIFSNILGITYSISNKSTYSRLTVCIGPLQRAVC